MADIRDFLRKMNSASTVSKGNARGSGNSEPASPSTPKDISPQQAIKDEFAHAFEQIQALHLKAIDAPISTDEAVNLKRQGKYLESSRFYADYVLKNRLFTPMLAMAWFKTLASAGDLSDALRIADYLDSLNPPMCYATNMLRQHKDGLRNLIRSGDYSALVSYLSSVSGNPNFHITRDEIDLLDSDVSSASGQVTKNTEVKVPEQITKAYNTILSLVETMDMAIQDIYNIPQEKRTEHMLGNQMRMDGILQGILLHVALADGDFTIEEQTFIEKITNRGQLLKLMQIESSGRINYTMHDLAAMSFQEKARFLDMMDNWISTKITDSLITPCAAFDAVSQQTDKTDFCEWVCKCVEMIVSFLAQLDGKIQQSEIAEYNTSINQLLRNPWIETRHHFQKQQ